MRAEVEFKAKRRENLFVPGNLDLKVGDWVVCRLEGVGEDMGKVVGLGGARTNEVGRILRVATEDDVERHRKHQKLEEDGFRICREKIEEKGLPMKLIDVESFFDGKRIRFYFLADRRIDFRELVKELAQVFKTRIEMRQIGVRDYAKMLGGVGPCGRALCCASFLNAFEPVSMEIAKEQSLLLSPTKLSGVCGRLMCCLNYERFLYEEELKRFPPISSSVETEKGRGTVLRIDIFRDAFYLKHDDESEEEVSLEKWRKRKRRPWRLRPRKKTHQED